MEFGTRIIEVAGQKITTAYLLITAGHNGGAKFDFWHRTQLQNQAIDWPIWRTMNPEALARRQRLIEEGRAKKERTSLNRWVKILYLSFDVILGLQSQVAVFLCFFASLFLILIISDFHSSTKFFSSRVISLELFIWVLMWFCLQFASKISYGQWPVLPAPVEWHIKAHLSYKREQNKRLHLPSQQYMPDPIRPQSHQLRKYQNEDRTFRIHRIGQPVIWNRDHNACRNMIYKTLCKLRNKTIEGCFRRGYRQQQ